MTKAALLPLLLSTVLLAAVALSTPAAFADDDDDHERARRAVQAGEVLPLRTILDHVARDFPGDVIETELEESDGAFIYEIKVISPEGRVMKIHYNARTGSVLRVKGKRP